MSATSLGGAMDQTAHDAVTPQLHEARIVEVSGTSEVRVRIRGLAGESQVLPARGYAPRIAAGPTVVAAQAGDRVWVTPDDGGQLVVMAWEPA